jgi:nitrate reductase delta subunit
LALPPSGPARRLVGFGQWFLAADPADLRVDYVQTFDHRRRQALYVTFASAGETRRRGAALLAFQRLYAASGYRARADELPDYLPTVLQFAALAPAADSAAALELARPGIESIGRSLLAAGSPWAPLLAAVTELLPPLAPEAERRLADLVAEGPPTELVGAGADGMGLGR